MISYNRPDERRIAHEMKDLWELLTPTQQALLANSWSVCKYKKNEPIYRCGEEPTSLLCLISGKVKIYSDGYDAFSHGYPNRPIINRVLRPGQYFGYRASLEGSSYITCASAIEEAVIVSVPMFVICNILDENNRLARLFLKMMAADLGTADKRLLCLTQKHVRGRLADTLLFLYNIYGVEIDGKTLNLKISREDLAGLSNMTTSNAIRTLSNFKDEGVIAISGKKLEILCLDDLEHISKNG